MHINYTNEDVLIMAKTIYGEARGLYKKIDGGLAALISVGNVIINRLKEKSWFGGSIKDVCLKPYQFSCWNKNDPNREVIEKVDINESLFKICYDVANKLLMGAYPDLTKNSNHYYATWLENKPYWADGKKPQMKISDHVFFHI